MLSMVGFSRLDGPAGQIGVVIPLMLLGLGWSLFQSPNLSGMFNAVESRYVGAVSGLSLTSANIANAMGVAVGSVLFMRWLDFYGLASGSVPPYTQWGGNADVFVKAFQGSWTVIAGLARHRHCHVSYARSGSGRKKQAQLSRRGHEEVRINSATCHSSYRCTRRDGLGLQSCKAGTSCH